MVSYHRPFMGQPGRSYKFLVSAIRKRTEQKRSIETRAALHKNMTGNNELTEIFTNGLMSTDVE